MTYNPRIKNKRNEVIQVSGSALSVTGAISITENITVSKIINTDYITASTGITGSSARFTSITGNLFGTASYASFAGNSNTVTNGAYTNIANTFTGVNTFNTVYVTASAGITGSDAKFASITGAHAGSGAGLTNIPNGALINSSLTIGSTAISLGASTTILSGLTQLSSSGIFISGDLRVNGTASIGQLNTLTQQSLIIGDKYITLLSGAADHASLDGSGILWGSGSFGDPTQNELGANAHVRFRSSSDTIEIFPGLSVSGGTGVQITGNLSILGNSTFNGSLSGTSAQFTTITASFITASVISASQISFDSFVYPNYILIAEGYTSSSGGTFSEIGVASGPNTSIQYNASGYLTGSINLNYNNSTNILSGVTAQFINITASIISASQFIGSGIGGGTPGGTNQTIQFNSGSTFTGSTSLIYNYTTNTLSGTTAQFTSITGTLNGLATNALVASSSITLNSNNHVILASASLSNITITLPLAASSPFRQYIIKKTDSNSSKIIISGTSGQTIDGNLGREINTQYESITLISDGNNQWFIL